MPLTGTHISFGYAGDESQKDGGAGIKGPTTNSQTMAAAGTSDAVAPAKRGDENPIVSIVSGSDIFFAIGKNPNAGSGSSARDYLKANDPVDRYCSPGDKVAWIVAS